MPYWVKWLMQYNKAFVPFIMIGIYFINNRYGIELPIDSDDATLVLGAITSLVVYQIPNHRLDE